MNNILKNIMSLIGLFLEISAAIIINSLNIWMWFNYFKYSWLLITIGSIVSAAVVIITSTILFCGFKLIKSIVK